jgi:hypothetical protein
MTRVLIAEADIDQVRALCQIFQKKRPDLTISTAGTTAAATRQMREQAVDFLLIGSPLDDAGSLDLVAWALEHSPETETLSMNGVGVVESPGRTAWRAFEPEEVLARTCDALNQTVRGYLDNVSLASLLQLLEMERKTCTLSVTCGPRDGVLVVSKGVLVGARTGDLQGEAGAIAIVAWPGANVTLSRRPVDAGIEIHSSLGFILIEAMRLVDEAARHRGKGEGSSPTWPIPKRTYRPPAINGSGATFDSARPPGELGLPSGASGLAVVEISTGNVLRSASREDCPIGELARLASQLLLQESATLRLCGETEGVEELVLSTTTRCDVIRPLNQNEFALLVFAPEETNLVIARLELDHFIAVEKAARSS